MLNRDEEADGGMVTMVVMRSVKVGVEEAVRVLNAGNIEVQVLKKGKLEEAAQVLKAGKMEVRFEGHQIGANFPCRPGYGTRESKVVLWTNYIEIIQSQKLALYRYNNAVQPAATGKRLSRMIRLLLSLLEYGDFRDNIVKDFRSTLVSRRELLSINSDAAIHYQAEGEDQPRANAPSYQLRVQETGIFTVSEFIIYLNSTDVNTTYAQKLPVLQPLNIFLGYFAKPSPTFATVGISKSFSIIQAAPKQDLVKGLSALLGFFSIIRLATCRILVNVNVSHGTFYDAIPLGNLIEKYGVSNIRGCNPFSSECESR